MFKRKLRALNYHSPDSFNVNGETINFNFCIIKTINLNPSGYCQETIQLQLVQIV